MGAFNAGVSPVTINQVMRGLQRRRANGEVSFADRICRRIGVPGISGKTFIEPSVISIEPDGLDAGLPHGTSVKRRGGGLEELAFHLRMFKDLDEVPFADKIDGNAAGYDTVANRMAYSMAITDMKLDLHLSRMLSNVDDDGNAAEYNRTFDMTADGGGQWNIETSKPLKALKLMKREVGAIDTVVIGDLVVTELAGNAQFLGNAGFRIEAGEVQHTDVQRIIASKLGIPLERVIIFDAYYRKGSGEGVNMELQRLFDKGIWMGIGEDLVMFDLDPENPRAINEPNKVDENVVVGYSRSAEIKRPHPELGIYSQAVA